MSTHRRPLGGQSSFYPSPILSRYLPLARLLFWLLCFRTSTTDLFARHLGRHPADDLQAALELPRHVVRDGPACFPHSQTRPSLLEPTASRPRLSEPYRTEQQPTPKTLTYYLHPPPKT
ncbi:hypothetical protein K456DRAFT_283159 [Colletotrichum gloeosporioides 23]|nr:hypothetical protein K456DRAFT_283159 [Colletotrichum gloeosporioides 23]